MITIPLLDNSCTARAQYLAAAEIPPFYMEDFTILGIAVDNYSLADTLLQKAGYTVQARPGGGQIAIPHASQLVSIMEMLSAGGISATFGDVADTMYQA